MNALLSTPLTAHPAIALAPVFSTPYRQHAEHNGKAFTLVRVLVGAEEAADGGRNDMYLIRVSSGEQLEAFAEEVLS